MVGVYIYYSNSKNSKITYDKILYIKGIMTNKFDILTNTFIKTKRNPKIRFIDHGGIHGIIIDTPKVQEDMYHGSSFEIVCNRPIAICKICGDLAVRRDLENSTKENLEKLDCEIIDIHRHPEEILFQIKESEKKESHLHFRCSDKTFNDTTKIVNFIKDY